MACLARCASRLGEIVRSQARLIEVVARFDAEHSAQNHPQGAFGATLSQIIDFHKHYRGISKTGEFALA